MKRPSLLSIKTLKKVPETIAFGQLIGGLLKPDDVLGLGGVLGSGKTVLAAAIAGGIGLAEGEYVSSPSFAIIHEYDSAIALFHMDFYRCSSEIDIETLGVREYFFRQGICLIEWYERGASLMPSTSLLLDLEITGDTTRTIRCYGDDTWERRLSAVNIIG
ncbi:MAG: tRNA (adenosine(37)-N6)-threonylcarbamoyltransferase complex ATPase subunit type 1 TsaE [Desulfofustis sp. PB-SRB1]|nr:tRNA (adenosine(37)-N6)-threonylcarbamoyltransferase complex ATPase subunit type 1 TsaE [Desulfofustis sp. PB-SRB1]MBM1001232.1 tRNA (adenosine(37)-N6)-threonylcarbamoyltransferase complex ATPase subunit type 1 TsaE [Desulfofustis sp. PB-SRB1]HBH28284.1 tRNA (adenosine(37)-N6)-threonylcarbamoyltransferase complex ATPase subunit type 1 TsaE [Desulfofustis sp.]HBH32823.1 tRNA (adenosine(37)-N6)-threonylcarbamoyltransferase complex ATPase subunit type 1 TsaE [Desulfofustis sp.]